MKKLFVLDASGFIFRAYFALPEMRNLSGETVQAVFGFIRSLQKLIKEFSPEYMVAVFDGPHNKESRKEIYSEYKSNRVRRYEDMPNQIQLVKDYCTLIGLHYLEIPSVEADDVIGSVVKEAVHKGFDVCICSTDKDLFQLVDANVSILNPWKESRELHINDVREIFGVAPHQIADYLALVGDTSDNIPGVSGCGPKKAVSLLKQFGSIEELLEHVDQLKDSMQRMLLDQRERLEISKALATLCPVSLPVDVSILRFPLTSVDPAAVNTFCLRNGFKTLVQESNAQKVMVECLRSPLEVEERLFTVRSSVALSVAYLGAHLPSLVPIGLAIATEQQAFYIEFSSSLVPVLQSFFKTHYCYGYNIKRDLHALQNVGIEVQVEYDLAVASHLIYAGAKVSFQTLLSEYHEDASLFGREWGSESLPVLKLPDQPEHYFTAWVSSLVRIKSSLLERIQEKGLERVFIDLEMPLEHVLFHMERQGVVVNTGKLSDLEEVFLKELIILTDEICTLAGEEFNPKSPKQLADVLYNKLGLQPLDKARSTRAEILEALSGQHPIIDRILKFRSIEKLLSTYICALPKQVDPRTRKIHPTFNQIGTVTGRLACQDPNLQNIPNRSDRGKQLRTAFCSPHGKQLLSADYSQVELRFLAHLSQDEALKSAFLSGEDVHTFTAAEVFHIPLKAVTPRQRSFAKTVNFGIIYGQTAFGLSKILKVGLAEAQHLIDAYFARYAQVAAFIEETITQASKEQKVETLLGRTRVIDSWNGGASVKAAAGRFAVNTRIQGSAAELIKLAMLQISDVFQKYKLKSRMVLQIHDELLFEVDDQEIEIVKHLVSSVMESAMVLSVPLVVDILIGKNWAEC